MSVASEINTRRKAFSYLDVIAATASVPAAAMRNGVFVRVPSV
jgi:hypothetical protein